MPKRALLGAAILAAIFASSCNEEEPVLRRFFTAVQTKDTGTLSTISAATYPWVIESWEILGTESSTTEPFKLSEIKLQVAELAKERAALVKEYTTFRLDNLKALKVIEARLEEEPEHTFDAKYAPVHEELVRYHDALQELELKRRSLMDASHRERTLARMSCMGAISDIDDFDGEVSITKMRVAIAGEGGATKNYVATLCRYDLVNQENNFRPRSSWIVAELEEEK